MLRIGLIGLGFMGRTHLENYLKLEAEGLDIRVVALCDMDSSKLSGQGSGGNIETTSNTIDFERFNKYTSIAEMLEQEELDCVDITLPTFLHADVTEQCLNAGLHVLCEKPMALNAAESERMIEAAEQNGKLLTIGQCLRFWPAYVYLKQLVEQGTYGHVTGGYFFRGGSTPTWGAWLIDKTKSGGALLDMHVHDTDMVQWLFGKPEAVSCLARNVVPGSGYDIVSTNYRYGDGKVINAQADWTLEGDFGFDMQFRVNFEKGNILFRNGEVKVNPNGEAGFVADLPTEQGYYYQLKEFVTGLLSGKQTNAASGISVKATMEVVDAEIQSADQGGEWVKL